MPARPPLTHFLCIPLITASSKPQLQASLQHFTSSITSPASRSGSSVPEKAIRPLGTLHLTLGVMSLQSKDRLDAALTFLKSLNLRQILQASSPIPPTADTSILLPDPLARTPSTPSGTIQTPSPEPFPPLIISLRGLHPMHTPSSTSILYASPCDPSGRLYSFCQALQCAFTDAGFLVPDTHPLKLHATIVNTIYAKDKSKRKRGEGHGRGGSGVGGGRLRDDRRREGMLDAGELIEEWKDWSWVDEVVLKKVAICEMGARVVDGREAEGEVYVEVGGVDMPCTERDGGEG